MKAIERGVRFKSVYPKGAVLPRMLEKLDPDKFSVRRYDTDFIRCDIIDDRKVMLKLVQPDPMHFGGIFFIENENLVSNLKKIFYEFWEQGE